MSLLNWYNIRVFKTLHENRSFVYGTAARAVQDECEQFPKTCSIICVKTNWHRVVSDPIHRNQTKTISLRASITIGRLVTSTCGLPAQTVYLSPCVLYPTPTSYLARSVFNSTIIFTRPPRSVGAPHSFPACVVALVPLLSEGSNRSTLSGKDLLRIL